MSRKSTSKKRAKKLPDFDPYLDREKEKYDNPIPSREFIIMHLTNASKPMRLNQIAETLNLTDPDALEGLRRRLKAMARDGQIVKTRRNGYGLANKMDLVKGRVIGHPDGYGFLVPDEGGTDLFLSEKQMWQIFHGDRILANVIGVNGRGKREGALVEILERNTKELTGRFFDKKGIAYIEPDNRRIPHRIMILKENVNHAKHGDIVMVRIIDYPNQYEPAIGEVISVLGQERAPGMEVDIAICDYNLPHEWSEDVSKEIQHFGEEVPQSAMQNRTDFRDIPFVTIDGEDARDFDDAVYCEPRGKGWLLRVAIADVSAYVKPNTALDQEAQTRGNSVYFPNRVIPMLPEVLSNGLCSLNPQVDRLCVICEMAIDMYGRTRRTHFYEGIMRSAARLTYNEVAAIFEGQREQFKQPELLPQLDNLYALYQLLLKKRQKRGAFEIDVPEIKILFGQQQKIDKLVALFRNDAHKLIEEMMLAANVATAEWLHQHDMSFLYRIHNGPTEDKLTELRTFLNELGLRLYGKEKPQAKHYGKLLEKITDRPDTRLIQTVLLRSMKMAIYTPDNVGHFGLSFDSYTHFTSPIRRYPDLIIHRAIKHVLKGKPPEKFLYDYGQLVDLGEHCSSTERRADEATRDAISWLKCEYMKDKIGNVYEGLITAVTSFGIFVELDGVFIEGLVHVTALDEDYYHFDPVRHCLVGEFSGRIYRLADRVKVKLMRVNVEEKKIDLELA